MRFYLGVTDFDWYNFLSKRDNEDINFWQPGGNSTFKVLSPGAPFLFKLKSPYNAVAGVGFFSSHSILPLDVAWDIFEKRNGLDSLVQFKRKIIGYRSGDNLFSANPNIGCIVLTDPIFFKPEDWITVPEDWSRSIVQGKSYDDSSEIGRRLWAKVELVLQSNRLFERIDNNKSQLILEEPESEYTRKYLTKVRLGQGAFRVQLTDAYSRKCSITGEKTLPVLEAAHIKPFADSGPNHIATGILLRADLHKLYDGGYITSTKDLKVEVSKKIKEEFQNGREYYQFHGKPLQILPDRYIDRPNEKYIEWHNNNVYNG
ncbi:MAG TPA: HNH endonuclease [Bacteroidales bacterium]|nr:HNH endonuclease [Bacteroidales bacterium]